MDKAVEELQQELKLLKNEIKETLTDVREVLLNTVENPFPQDSGASPILATPTPAAPAPVVAPPAPVADAAPEQPTPQQPQQFQQPQQQMPQGGGGGGGPMILGNLGGGGGAGMPPTNMMGMMSQTTPDMSAGPGLHPASAPESFESDQGFGGSGTGTATPAGGPGLPPGGRPSRAGSRGDAKGAGGPGLPPSGAGRRDARGAKEEDARGKRGRMPIKGRGDRPEGVGHSNGRSGATSVRDLEDDDSYDDSAYDGDEAFEDDYEEEYEGVARQPKGKVDLVVLASLSPWLTDGIRRMGRKRVKSLLEVYASMGGISVGMKEVLLQIVDLDDTEGVTEPVAVQDTMRFLIELDDLMWRGRQDWRRAALMTMLGAGLQPLGE